MLFWVNPVAHILWDTVPGAASVRIVSDVRSINIAPVGDLASGLGCSLHKMAMTWTRCCCNLCSGHIRLGMGSTLCVRGLVQHECKCMS
jgi:hypothetical protein